MASGSDTWGKLQETRSRLKRCLAVDIDWNLYPQTIEMVSKKPPAVYCHTKCLIHIVYIVIDQIMYSRFCAWAKCTKRTTSSNTLRQFFYNFYYK